MPDLKGKDIIRRFEKARTERANWENHWQEVADLVLPTRDFITEYSKGVVRRNRIYNDAAAAATDSLAAALDGLLTNTAIRWFSLAPNEPALVGNEEVEAWLYDATTKMLAWFDSSASGFAVTAHESYLDLVAFGTAVVLMRESPAAITFQARQLSNFYMSADETGDVREMFRRFEMTALEAAEQFGNALSGETLKMADDPKQYDQKIPFLHYIYRRSERQPGRDDAPNKRWASQYVEMKQKKVIAEGGFDHNPYLTPRWSKAPEETYGRSPAMKVLPTIKVTNAMARTQLEAAELAVRPPLMMPANSVEGPIRTAPGSIMYVRSGAREFPQPLTTGARPDIAEGMIQRHEDRIEKAFFLDSLKLPQRDRMTATEIIQRRQEGLLLASPVLARLYSEWLNPIITRTFSWMLQSERLAPMPEALSGRGLSIHYVSPMALSKRASESQAFLQAMNVATPLVQVDPSVMGNIDADRAFRAIMSQNNVSPLFLRTEAEVGGMREAQAEAQAQQEELASMQAGASAARDGAAAIKDIQGGDDGIF